MQPEEIPLHRFEDRFAHEQPFHVRRINVSAEQLSERIILPPHRHDFHEICLFFEASGVHHIDWNPYPIRDRLVFVLAPDAVHLIELRGEVQGYIICFKKDFVLSCQDDSFASLLASLEKHSPFTVADIPSLRLTVEQLMRETQAKAARHEEMFKAYVQILLIQLLRCREVTPQSEPEINGGEKPIAKIEAFKTLLETHYKEHASVQQYAARLSVSVKQLNRLSKAATGQTASRLIQQRLNAEAKRLLYNTSLSVKEIAFALGFREPSHFSHFFYKLNGMFPHSFREMVLDKREEARIDI